MKREVKMRTKKKLAMIMGLGLLILLAIQTNSPITKVKAQSLDLVITEIMYDGDTEPDDEYIEVYNAWDGTIDFAGWVIADTSFNGYYIIPNGAVDTGEYFVFGNSMGSHVDITYADSFTLNNGGDSIYFYDSYVDYDTDYSGGNLGANAIFQVTYDSNANGWPDNENGKAVEYSGDPETTTSTDQNDGSNWEIATNNFVGSLYGTPGSQNSAYPEIPFIEAFIFSLIGLIGFFFVHSKQKNIS